MEGEGGCAKCQRDEHELREEDFWTDRKRGGSFAGGMKSLSNLPTFILVKEKKVEKKKLYKKVHSLFLYTPYTLGHTCMPMLRRSLSQAGDLPHLGMSLDT
jgi:hypothetical protein